MSHWHELDGSMRAADDHYDFCPTCWSGPREREEGAVWVWECPTCGAMWYVKEEDEE